MVLPTPPKTSRELGLFFPLLRRTRNPTTGSLHMVPGEQGHEWEPPTRDHALHPLP